MHNIGGENLPVVIAARLDGNMDFNPQFMPDYVYVGRQLPEHPAEGVQYIIDARPLGRTNQCMACPSKENSAVYQRMQRIAEISVCHLHGTE